MTNVGHNLPDLYDDLKARTDSLIENANRWLKERPEITDADLAGRCSDFLDQITKHWKEVDTERDRQKRPHTTEAERVQARFRPLLDALDTAKKLLKTKLGAWLDREARRIEEERRKAAAEAEKKAKEAAEAAAAAENAATVQATLAADQAAKAAEQAKAEAAYLATATPQAKGDFGARARSLRTTLAGRIVDVDRCLAYYRENKTLVDTLYKIVNADIRAGNHTIPGVEIHEVKSVA
jgi:septal ring factor EnvC (AmiA/AmiB activator)